MVSFPIDQTPTDTITLRTEPDISTLVKLNINTVAALLQAGRLRLTGQSQIRQAVNVGGAAAVGEASTVDISTFSEDNVKLAYWDLGANRFRSSFTMTAAEYKNYLTNVELGGVNAGEDLLAFKSISARREILRKIGKAIFNGDGTAASGGIIGLEATLGSTTYAGINSATAGNELWVSRTLDGADGITRRSLDEFEATILSGDNPSNYDIVVMHPITATYYKSLFDQSVVYQVMPGQPVDLGYGSNLMYNGRPVIQDSNAAVDAIHFINTDALKLFFFDASAPDNLFGAELELDGIPMYVYKLPSANPELAKFGVYAKAALALVDRSGFSSITDIVEPVTP